MCFPMSQTQFYKEGKSETWVVSQVPVESRFRTESE